MKAVYDALGPIVNLVERVVTVSAKTMEIMRQLSVLNEKSLMANWPTTWRVM